MASYANLLNTVQRTTVEDFGNNIMEATHDIDPWSKNLVESSMGVTRDGLGRGWKKIQVFKTGLGGAASWRSVSGNANFADDDASQFLIYGSNAPQTFPDADEHTAPAYLQKVATLKEMFGSFTIPLEIMRLDQLDANMANQVGAILEGTARRVALREILAFWGEKGTGAYAKLTIGSTNRVIKAGGTATTAKLTSDDGLTYYDCLRLQPGECFDVLEEVTSTTFTHTNYINSAVRPVFVLFSDPINLEVQLEIFSGTGGTDDMTLTAGKTYHFLPKGSFTPVNVSSSTITVHQPTPLADVITNTATDTPYGLNLAAYPYFRSVVAAVSGPLTETVLNRYVGLAFAAKSMGDRIDNLVTTPGVKAEYIASLDYSGRREANRRPINLGEGFGEKFGYTYDGTEIPVDCSNYCPRGTLYGLKMRDNNWQKVTSPKIPGSGSDSRFGQGVEFIGSPTHPSIFVPTRAKTSAAMTDFVEAPFKRWLEFLPDYICGLKITGLHEMIGAYDGTS